MLVSTNPSGALPQAASGSSLASRCAWLRTGNSCDVNRCAACCPSGRVFISTASWFSSQPHNQAVTASAGVICQARAASAQASAAMGQALPAFARQALGSLAQSNVRQLAQGFPLPTRLPPGLEEEADLEMLLKLAAAAVSRLQTHQLSSLAQTQIGPDGALLTTWQLELPMRDQRDIVPLQIKLQREEEPRKQEKERGEPLWKIELAFDVAPLGPLQVQAQLTRGTLTSQLWAERSATAQLVATELTHLRERLQAAGLSVGELSCRQGTPPQGPSTNLEQRFVDEKA